MKKNEDTHRTLQKDLEIIIFEQKELETFLRLLEQEHLRSQTESQKRGELFRQTNEILSKFLIEIREYQPYAGIEGAPLFKGDINEIRSGYRAAKKVIDDADGSVVQIESTIASDRSAVDGYTQDIHDSGYFSNRSHHQESRYPQILMTVIQQLQEKIIELVTKRNTVNQLLEKANMEYQILYRRFIEKIDQYQKLTGELYSPGSEILDSTQYVSELAELTKQYPKNRRANSKSQSFSTRKKFPKGKRLEKDLWR